MMNYNYFIVYSIQAIVIIDGLTMITFYFTAPNKKILHKQNILLSINEFLKVKEK